MRTLMITLTWAIAFLIGGFLVTNGGIVQVDTNPVIRQILGVLSIAIGVYHLYNQFFAPRREESIAGR